MYCLLRGRVSNRNKTWYLDRRKEFRGINENSYNFIFYVQPCFMQ